MPSVHSGLPTIEFVGDLTIKTVDQRRARLIDALTGAPALRLDISTDAIVDLTFIQLIESARRTARQAGGEVHLARPASGSLLETLQRGGFLTAPEHRAFWLHNSEIA